MMMPSGRRWGAMRTAAPKRAVDGCHIARGNGGAGLQRRAFVPTAATPGVG